jgi:HEAT repeat protein
MNTRTRNALTAALVAGAAMLCASSGAADTARDRVLSGRAAVYKYIDPASLEDVSSPQAIRSVANGNVPPSQIWRILEHGERVECLDCIPHVSKLLFDSHPGTREISAWWLRRRIFGVFGPGQVYSEVVATLQGDSDERRRAFAAEALGEFLSASGVKFVARAAIQDASPVVRRSAVAALERLNYQGPNGEVALAMADSDEQVRLAALHAAIRVHVFTGLDAVVLLISDPSERVRRRAVEALGVMRAADAVVGVAQLTSPSTEPSADVRQAAVVTLGQIGDPAGKQAVLDAQSDPHQFVRDAARIALRRL